MNSGINFLKRAFGVGVFGIAIFFAASMTVNAQYRDNDSYYGRQNNRSYNRNQRTDKHHQKHEKQELKHHQRHEREWAELGVINFTFFQCHFYISPI